MDIQLIVNSILPIICVCIGWFCKELWTAVQVLKDELHDLRTHVAENYIHKEDFSNRWEEVLKAIHRIEDKLDALKEKQ